MRSFWKKISRAFETWLLEPVTVDGLCVAVGDPAISAKVIDALTLIQTYDPRRYARLLMDLARIQADVLPGALGRFVPSDQLCLLDERFLAVAKPIQIALVLVHEACHARLWKLGIRYDENVRARVEHVCIRRELSFALKLPDGRWWAHVVRRKLSSRTADVYTDAALRRHRMRGAIAAMQYLKAPRWYIAGMLTLRRAKMRRARKLARSKSS